MKVSDFDLQPVLPSLIEMEPGEGREKVDAAGRKPQLVDEARFCQVFGPETVSASGAPNSARAAKAFAAFSGVGRSQRSRSPVARGTPWTAMA